ncbi:ABC transporter substrate-binding protein [Terrimonas pollutisoli]|uniref:ABC transporter substrate-binding protein n=1 Tax=Terrimonas pollutisoli TaxID=3034147 RepID=UPI0023EA96C6|nr:ABC transporter substrate-binding protein [Terrimonas sp. H1YJ31]
MKIKAWYLIFALVLSQSVVLSQDTLSKYKIAIFAPLYLDSAFDGVNNYKYAKNVFPKFINSGLEFYEGARLALDSLNKEGAELEVYVYDTRSATEKFEEQLMKPELNDVSLIIAHCSNNEVRLLAETALKKKIPVINTTVPNDAGTVSNPFFVILNPTLKTQCEGIYRYIQKYFAINPVIMFKRKGTFDDQIKKILDDYSKSTSSVPLKIKYVELPDNFSTTQLKAYLDSNRTTLCMAGSLDINFGKRLASSLASLVNEYPAVVMGMPTWDGIKEFNKPEFKGIEIIYSSPFYNAKTDKVSESINEYFNTVMFARPSDMVFRGYEVTWKFAKLLAKYKNDLASNIGNKQGNIFTDFDIQPVLNKQTMELDYFENKKLYFLKWEDGIVKGVNW